MINLLRVLACGAFLLAAAADNSLPLFVLYAGGAAAVTMMALRAFPDTAFALGLAAGTAMVAVQVGVHLHDGGRRWLVVGVTVAAVVCWLGYTARLCFVSGTTEGASLRPPALAETTIAAGLAAAPAAAAALLVLSGPYLPATGRGLVVVRSILLVGGIGAVTSAAFLAVLVAVLTSGRAIDRQVDDWWPLLPRPDRLRWTVTRPDRPAPRGDGFDSLRRSVVLFGYRTRLAAVRLAASTLNLLRLTGHMLVVNSVRLANWLHGVVVRTGRRIAACARAAARLLLHAVELTVAAGAVAGRVVIVGSLALVAVAIMGYLAADANRAYLVAGHATDLAGTSAGLAALALAILVLIAAFSRLPLDAVLASYGRSLAAALPRALLMIAVGGLAVGLPGTLGYGPIRLGWVTCASWVLLAGVLLTTGRSRAASLRGTA